jgi:hypothetical protein
MKDALQERLREMAVTSGSYPNRGFVREIIDRAKLTYRGLTCDVEQIRHIPKSGGGTNSLLWFDRGAFDEIEKKMESYPVEQRGVIFSWELMFKAYETLNRDNTLPTNTVYSRFVSVPKNLGGTSANVLGLAHYTSSLEPPIRVDLIGRRVGNVIQFVGT